VLQQDLLIATARSKRAEVSRSLEIYKMMAATRAVPRFSPPHMPWHCVGAFCAAPHRDAGSRTPDTPQRLQLPQTYLYQEDDCMY